MKCPKCGAWNKAYMPKCFSCGAALDNNTSAEAPWEESLHKKKPSLQIVEYDKKDGTEVLDLTEEELNPPAQSDPEHPDQTEVVEELEALARRRKSGLRRIRQMAKEQAEQAKESIASAEIVRPVPAPDDSEPSLSYRQAQKKKQYSAKYVPGEDEEDDNHFDPTIEKPILYDDDDENAPYYYDGYEPEPGVEDSESEYTPHRVQYTRNRQEDFRAYNGTGRRKRLPLPAKILIALLLIVLIGVLSVTAGIFVARRFILKQTLSVMQNSNTQTELTQTTVNVSGTEYPAHTLTVYGKENATIYLKETGSSYVIADGKAEITIPDYMWYDTDSSTYAVAATGDTMDITLTPYIRYSQEGEQYAMEPIRFTIDVPLSPIYLLNPSAPKMDVSVSIFEVRINVTKGSTVMIDGTNVSTLIRDTGNVSKNVQVLPIGDNIINISVKSKYCREQTMEVVLHRDEQEIPLELSPTVITEWNYENDNELYQASISGTTLPGATLTIESPYENLDYNQETGEFTFRPLFYGLGDNDVVIRAAYSGRKDSVIHHTVYYMPTPEVYTRKAWSLSDGYSDLLNYISMRIGTIYVGEGTITRIISSSPQMAVMDIGELGIEKEVMLENSSKTTWKLGQKYRIYGDVYGMYGSIPRLTVRYTYDASEK